MLRTCIWRVEQHHLKPGSNAWLHSHPLSPCPVCPAPCSYQSEDVSRPSLTLQAGQCELRFQEMVAVTAGWPPALLAKGGGLPFVAGAPIVVWGPEVRE